VLARTDRNTLTSMHEKLRSRSGHAVLRCTIVALLLATNACGAASDPPPQSEDPGGVAPPASAAPDIIAPVTPPAATRTLAAERARSASDVSTPANLLAPILAAPSPMQSPQ
jgi:hypothetical protein